MRNSFPVCFLFLIFCWLALPSAAFAQTELQQWEYLEIQESSSVNLNELGKKGWELVGFHQNEGQPVRFIFKRPLSAERTRLEAAQQTANEAVKPKAQFVDLDRLEAQNEQKENESKANQKIEQAIRSVKGYTFASIKTASWFPSADNRRVVADVVIDASRELLKDGGNYRSSEAKKLVRQAALEIFRGAQLKPLYANKETFTESAPANFNGVTIRLRVVVSYEGVDKTVAEGAVLGLWSPEQYP